MVVVCLTKTGSNTGTRVATAAGARHCVTDEPPESVVVTHVVSPTSETEAELLTNDWEVLEYMEV